MEPDYKAMWERHIAVFQYLYSREERPEYKDFFASVLKGIKKIEEKYTKPKEPHATPQEPEH